MQRLLQQPPGRGTRRYRSDRSLLRAEAHDLSAALQDQALVHSANLMLGSPRGTGVPEAAAAVAEPVSELVVARSAQGRVQQL